MVIWGLYLSVFWAISIYSVFQDLSRPERRMSSVENVITSVTITSCILGLFYPFIGQALAPFLIILLPLSAYFEISNALGDLKSSRIKDQIGDEIPEDMLHKIVFYTLSAILLPGYIAGLMVLIKYGNI
jgi:hypothetical protein|tara:strand:+ start:222 stop:608 length:387 start_codon:yes stop_codon:yes gene_type:complete